jgi:ComF family protein
MGILSKFLDLIYPPRCHICQRFLSEKEGLALDLCNTCLSGLVKISSPLCPQCGTPFISQVEEDHLCGECLKKRPYFDILAAPFRYEGVIMDAVHQLKYNGKMHIAKSAGGLLGPFARERFGETRDFLIMPVPLHPIRLRERGFNQSLVLARAVGAFLETRLDFTSLRRLKYTQPQTGLKRHEREKNVKGVFGIEGCTDLAGKSVLLMDDVATTGNTFNECAKVLKKAGCDRVYCLALARAVW